MRLAVQIVELDGDQAVMRRSAGRTEIHEVPGGACIEIRGAGSDASVRRVLISREDLRAPDRMPETVAALEMKKTHLFAVDDVNAPILAPAHQQIHHARARLQSLERQQNGVRAAQIQVVVLQGLPVSRRVGIHRWYRQVGSEKT